MSLLSVDVCCFGHIGREPVSKKGPDGSEKAYQCRRHRRLQFSLCLESQSIKCCGNITWTPFPGPRDAGSRTGPIPSHYAMHSKKRRDVRESNTRGWCLLLFQPSIKPQFLLSSLNPTQFGHANEAGALTKMRGTNGTLQRRSMAGWRFGSSGQ